VVRITMKNFMTYKHETIWPGKKKRTYVFCCSEGSDS
jgi:hypothetical protein